MTRRSLLFFSVKKKGVYNGSGCCVLLTSFVITCYILSIVNTV